MTSKSLLVVFLLFGLTGFGAIHHAPKMSSHQANNSASSTAQARAVAANFAVQKLADNVYAVIRQDLAGFMVDANNVFIINDDDVIVVDTNGAPSITREVLAALRKLTNKPVRYVINTHYHDDHIRGNQVYREAFPQVEFIGSAFSRDYLPNQGAINRRNFLEGAPKFATQIREHLDKNESLFGGAMTAEERDSSASDLRLIDLVLSEADAAPTVLPTITVADQLTLHRGNRVIEIRQPGNGHTAGDLVVHLPKEGILITGDLVVWPVPLVGNPQSHIGDWAVTLTKLRALHPTIIVPGHGQILRDDAYLKTLADLFASIKQQVEAAVARGETLEQTRNSVNLVDFRNQLAGESRIRKALFANYVAYPAIAAAYGEATAKR